MNEEVIINLLSLAAMFSQRFLLSLILLLQYSRFTECNSAEYFINPPTNLPCLGQPCLTFQQFAANAFKHIKNDTVLRFSSGIHNSPSTGLNVANKERFSSISENMDTVITCNQSNVFRFDNVAMITITNLTFKGCGKSSLNGTTAVIKIFYSTININHCTFIHSKGRVIDTQFSEVIITENLFKFSRGTVLSANSNSTVNVTGSIYEFNNNINLSNGSSLYISSSDAFFESCIFRNNSIQGSIRMIYIKNSTLTLNKCEFASNRARINILLSLCSKINILGTTFKHNYVNSVGMASLDKSWSTISNSRFLGNVVSRSGGLRISKGKANLSNLIIQENKARWGVLYIYQSEVQTYQDILIQGNNATLSTVDFRKSTITLKGNLRFLNNTGCILIEESQTEFMKSGIFSFNEQVNHKSWVSSFNYDFGGAITSIWSTVRFNGNNKFRRNKSWKVGGAILAIESRLYANNIHLSDNSAKEGGALYLDGSNFICKEVCLFAGNMALSKGGAIHARNSLIYIGYEWHTLQQTKNIMPTNLSFIQNVANIAGGGLSLEANAKLQGPLEQTYKYVIRFKNNTALKGGAVYVDDYTSTGTCNGTHYSTCFFNIPHFPSSEGKVKISSNCGKFTLYGGLLDRCIQKTTLTDFLRSKDKKTTLTGIDYLKNISKNPNIQQMITSDPVRICFCKGEKYNCTDDNISQKIKNGGTFNVSVIAVDQVERPVNAKIHFEHQSRHIRLGTGQQVKDIHNRCSNVTLTLYSQNYPLSTKLTLYADGPCRGIGISQRTLRVTILPCKCPVGFQPLVLNKSEGCSCDCSSQLKPHKVICNQTSWSLIRQGDFWINYTNDSGTIHYVIYPHCPYDYCLPPTNNVSINLNLPNGVDAQCAHSRTELLCSKCESGLSLSLGSSLCLSCPKGWPKIFVIILLGAMASGIALVMVIFVLNLTVAVGSLNGLIFYANIMASNNITYCPLSKSNFFSVIIAWFNLELGLDTCFYKGLDTYSKAWLQFAFPAYLIAVLFTAIIMSKYSSKFAKLIGKRNPIATLATLILLSYMKFLRNIIDILSAAVVHYEGSRKVLWLPDANVKYLQGKHIPLFLMAIAIVAIGLIYTFLLLTWQWLLRAPNYKLFRWIRNTRLNLFMEANVAAYNSKHRYWIGLLLLIRVLLYLEIAYNNFNETNASLLATALIAACLLFVKTLYGSKVYKNKMIDYLDSSCYLNLLILSTAQLYSQHNKTGQIIATKISVTVAFVQFLFVLTYHAIKTILEIPCLSRIKTSSTKRLQKHLKLGEILPFSSQEMEIMTQATTTRVTPTSTEIGLSDSIETSTAQNGEEQDLSGKVPQLLTTEWKETNSLREPLLQEN